MMENAQKRARSAELSDEFLDSVEAVSRTGLDAFRRPADAVTYPLDGAGTAGGRRMERRNKRSRGSPMDVLAGLPAMVMLERIPVPALAFTRDGVVLYANAAFAEMVGYPRDRLAGLAFRQIFDAVPAVVGMVFGFDALTNLVVELRHHEGFTVRARMSKSVLMRRDDPLLLVTFENLTERPQAYDGECGW